MPSARKLLAVLAVVAVAAGAGSVAAAERKEFRDKGNVRGVCAGTDKGPSVEYYLARPRNVGDLHGQAPVLWSASALLR
jgi:hypothetical protein